MTPNLTGAGGQQGLGAHWRGPGADGQRGGYALRLSAGGDPWPPSQREAAALKPVALRQGTAQGFGECLLAPNPSGAGASGV